MFSTDWQTSKREYGVAIERNVDIPVGNGITMKADIYRPAFAFTGVGRLKHRPDEELLLRALVQTFLDHSLCIVEETPHRRENGLRQANGL